MKFHSCWIDKDCRQYKSPYLLFASTDKLMLTLSIPFERSFPGDKLTFNGRIIKLYRRNVKSNTS